MSTDHGRDSRLDTPTKDLPTEMFYHPLAVFESQCLFKDNKRSLQGCLREDDCSAVLLRENVYIKGSPQSEASCGQLLVYSLAERSFDFLSTPEGVVWKYTLAVWRNQLVLIGGVSKDDQISRKVWILVGHTWKDDIILPVPGDGVIVSSASHNDDLIVLCKLSVNVQHPPLPRFFPTKVYCYSGYNWSQAYPGPDLQIQQNADIIVHNDNLYTIAHQCGQTATAYKALLSTKDISKWSLAGASVLLVSRITIYGNKLIVASNDPRNSNIELYTPFTNAKNGTSLVDIDHLSLEFRKIFCVLGHNQSLLVIGEQLDGDTHSSWLSVVEFTSKVTPYDSGNHFTLKAIKKLECIGGIKVLTNDDLESKLSDIKRFAGFNVQRRHDVSEMVLQYMDCWLCDYKNETSRSVAKPTWRKFFDALEFVDLSALARHIEKYLKKAPESEIEEPEDKEVSGMEDLRKLHVQLKQLSNRLSSNEVTDPRKIKEGICAAYHQCCTVSRKVEQGQVNSKTEVEQLRTEKEKLLLENENLKEDNELLKTEKEKLLQKNKKHEDEIDSLRKLAERGDPPSAKRLRRDENSAKDNTFPGSQEPPNIRLLQRELNNPVASKWEDIGIQLEIEEGQLRRVKSDNSDSQTRLREMLRIWLKRVNPPPSWEHICESLNVLGEQKLAAHISRMYLNK